MGPEKRMGALSPLTPAISRFLQIVGEPDSLLSAAGLNAK